MGLFAIFKWKKPVRKKRTQTKRMVQRNKTHIQKFSSDIEAIRNQINTINIILRKHDSDLGEQSTVIKVNTQKLMKLETIVTDYSSVMTNPTIQETNQLKRPVSTFAPASTPEPAMSFVNQKLDISRFSPQEKRILSIFFNNHDMTLSYADIAKTMGKSPNTVKNQMNQINIKADLFNYSVDNDNRKRFRLKKGVAIEKYLNISG